MNLYAGIDGGQSSTVAVIGDAYGRIVGRGQAGPADEIGVGSASTRLRDALGDALADARHRAGLTDDRRFETIVAGVSGYDGRVYGQAPQLPAARVRLMHDTPIAHAGALGGRAGIVVIAGTGSVVYGRKDNGWSSTLGGWGFLFGDEGSAFAVVRDGLALLMRACDDGNDSLEEIARTVCDFFEAASLRRLVHDFYKGGVTRERLASFAPIALRYEAFRALANRGAERLAALVCSLIASGVPARVALVGGIFGDLAVRQRVCDEILQRYPQAQIVEPSYEPVYGALLLAYHEAGIDLRELIL